MNVDILGEWCQKENPFTIFQKPKLKQLRQKLKKINELLTHISTNNPTELNELIYTGEKLICSKIGVLRKNTDRNSKPRWETRLETQIRNLRQLAKVLRQMNNARIYRDKKKKNTIRTNDTTQGNKSEGSAKEED